MTPDIVKDASRLINDATTWLYFIIPATAGLFFAYHAWMKSMSDSDPAEIKARNLAMKRSVLWGVVALAANAIVDLVFSYFK